MKCNYCGKDAQFRLKNGKWCCKENFQSCPAVREKNSKGQKVNYKFTTQNPSTIKVECSYCGKSSNVSNIGRHERGCFNNPKNKKYCVVCGKQLTQKQFWYKNTTCSCACSNKHFAYLRNKPEKYKNYRTIGFYHNGNKCENCGYNEHDILQIHHIDKNRKNNKKENLIVLCPNCHAGITFGKAILENRKVIWK
jgi:hypothetical protein